MRAALTVGTGPRNLGTPRVAHRPSGLGSIAALRHASGSAGGVATGLTATLTATRITVGGSPWPRWTTGASWRRRSPDPALWPGTAPPGTATPASLRIAYQDDEEEWASLQPDFVVISRRDDHSLGAAIVDPHGDHLADAKAKLRALADFAERHEGRFVRVESVAKVDDGSLRVLDLTDEDVRAAVRAFEGGKVSALYESENSRPYP